MKNLFIIANWKANKTGEDTRIWLEEFKKNRGIVDEKWEGKEIIVCPPFTDIKVFHESVRDLELELKAGAQNVSQFKEGAYTGEITSQMLTGFVSYCIVGHSERRKYFGESDDDVIDKVKNLLKAEVTPILCISDFSQLDSYIERGKELIERAEDIIFVYEPPSAISGGGDYKPESPEKAADEINKIRERIGKEIRVLYGGSINSENVGSFFTQENIDGGLIGQASLDPLEFLRIIKNA